MRRAQAVGWVVGLTWAMLWGTELRAQLPGMPGGQLPGMPGQIGQPGQRGQVAFPDTGQAEVEKRKVARSLRRVSPAKVRYTTYAADTILYDINAIGYWDEADTLSGFVQHLGAIGKPVNRYLEGLPDYYREVPLFRDPLTGRTDPYTLTPEYQLPYYDTRTPLVRIRFDQAAKSVQLLSFDISQNVTPFWNTTLTYRRRTSLGAYANSVVDHYAVGLTMSFSSFSRRFAATVGAVVNLQRDQLSGGMAEAGGSDPDSAFRVDKFTVPTLLSGASTDRRSRLVSAVGSLRLLGDTANAVTLVAGARFSEYWRKYEDQYQPSFSFSGDTLRPTERGVRYRPYGRIEPIRPPAQVFLQGDTISYTLLSFRDEYLVYQPSGFVGARINLRLGGLQATLQGELETQYTFAQDSLPGNLVTQTLEQTKNTLRAVLLASDTSPLPRFRVRAVGEYATNTLLSDEVKLSGAVSWGFLRERLTVVDSQWRENKNRWFKKAVKYPVLYTPLLIEAEALFHNRNPSLFDARWQTNTFRPNAGLSNETVLSLAGSIRWESRPRAGDGYLLLPNYGGVRVFFSSLLNPIVYTAQARPEQGGGGQQILWQGATLSGRLRWWRVYLEGRSTLQVGSSSGGLERFARAQPNAYGTLSLFFRNKVFREGQTFVQAGVDAHFFSSFVPLSLEPSLQSWYPLLDARVPGYARFDGYVSASFGQAMVYLKYIHFNEFAFAPGYFTTPYYPMLERTFSFGVSWRFFD